MVNERYLGGAGYIFILLGFFLSSLVKKVEVIKEQKNR